MEELLLAIESSKALKEYKTIHEIIEEEKAIKFSAPPKLKTIDYTAVIGYDSNKKRFGKGDRAKKKSNYFKR